MANRGATYHPTVVGGDPSSITPARFRVSDDGRSSQTSCFLVPRRSSSGSQIGSSIFKRRSRRAMWHRWPGCRVLWFKQRPVCNQSTPGSSMFQWLVIRIVAKCGHRGHRVGQASHPGPSIGGLRNVVPRVERIQTSTAVDSDEDLCARGTRLR